MLTVLAGFNVPEVMIPLYALFAILLALTTWLIYYFVQRSRNKPLPKHLFIKALVVYALLITALYFVLSVLDI